MSEKDYIGFDPVAWVERLCDVNSTSQFKPEAKDEIEKHLRHLQIALSVRLDCPPKQKEQGHNFSCGIDGEKCCLCGCQLFTIMRDRTEASVKPCPGRKRE